MIVSTLPQWLLAPGVSLVAAVAPAPQTATARPDAASQAQVARAQDAQPAREASADAGEALPAKLRFPAATEDLVLAWTPEGEPPSMLDLVLQYGRSTGQQLAFSEETRNYLVSTNVPLDRPVSVPRAEVQSYFECLLSAASFVLAVERAESPRVISVSSLNTSARNTVRSKAVVVPIESIDLWKDHPAIIVSTVVDLPNMDVRQVSNSLRTMITDANTQQLIPAGNSSSMVVSGFADSVAGLIGQLREIDAASAESSGAVEVAHELIRLQNADCAEVAPLVEVALDRARELRFRFDPAVPQQPQQAARGGNSVHAHPRLNALLVTCRADELDEARRIIALLDVK